MFDTMIELGENFAALLSLIFLFSLFSKVVLKNKSLLLPLVVGLLFSAAAIFGMFHPVKIMEGVIVDARIVLVALAGTFGGPISALIAAFIVAGYRMYLGGAGTAAGVVVIILAGIIGSFFSWEKIKNKKANYRFWVLGLILAIVGLSAVLLLPTAMIIPVLQKLSLPVLISYPLATVLFGTLFGFEITRQDTALKLLESEARFRLLAENSTDMISRHDAQGNYLYASPACRALLGYEPEELLGHSAFEFIHPDDIPTVDQSRSNIIEQPILSTTVFRIRRKNGEYTWLETTSHLVFDQTGNAVEIHAASRDISERKRAEEALRESETLLRSAAEAAPIILFTLDTNGIFQLSVGAGLKSLGLKPGQVVGLSHFDVYKDLEYANENVRRALKGETVNFTIDALGVAWDVHYSPLYGSNTDIKGMVGTAVDITERRQAEEDIRQLNASLEQRVEQRTRELREAQEQLVQQEKLAVLGQVAGSMGHELRNPLGVISNAVYFLKMVQADASEKIKEYLNTIERETRISEKIVADLLDFVRVESAQRQSISISDLVRQTLGRFPAPVSVQVELDLPPDLPQAFVDSRQVVQVLGNLVLNAYQALVSTKAGKLVISAQMPNGMICVTVRDNGMGISPENIEKIFEPLFSTKTIGIGLGLAVSKKLIEANGGRIEAQSEVGAGSTFSVYLPAYPEKL